MEGNVAAALCSFEKKAKRSSGSNCCIPQCHTTKSKCRGLAFVRIPRKGVSGEQDKWREAVMVAVSRDERLDKSFNPDTARICSRHFEDGCVTYGPSGKCTGLVMGSLPTRWMPTKSVITPKTSRSEPTFREPPPLVERVAYWGYEDLRKDLHTLPTRWTIIQNSCVAFSCGLPWEHGWKIVVSVTAEGGLLAEVQAFGLPAPQLRTSLETKKLQRFLVELQDMNMCTGVIDEALQDLAGPPDGRSLYFRHIQYIHENGKMTYCSRVRSAQCWALLPPEIKGRCKPCVHTERLLRGKKKRREASIERPVRVNDPLHTIDPAKLKAAFKQERQNNARLQKELEVFKESMKKDSIELSADMHNNLCAVDSSNLDPLQRLFWEEQQKAFKRKTHGMRWHPMLIRLAILLHSKSQAAYDCLRKTGVLQLPGSATLREYTSATHPQEGFQAEVKLELKKAAEQLEEHNRFVVLLHDEMSIKADLVFDHTTGQLVGFVNKAEWSFDCVEQPQNKLATHALVFFVVGVSSHIKMSLGYFGTQGVRADDLMPLLWTAIGFVEETGLKVIASTSDKASPNQRLYQLHQLPGDEGVCFKATNIFALEREVFFVSDPPHLIKTVRNNLESSGSPTRLLWKDGQYLLWKHIRDVYHMNMETGLRRTNLRLEHLNLTPHSKMSVKLAAQVLSQRVGRVMQTYGSPHCQETARFVLLMDRFFDCLNTRHLYEADRTRKLDLQPYTSVDDHRFDFLQKEFLGYLEAWRTSVDNRPGNYSRTDRGKMFLTHQTLKGLVMTVHAFVGATKYLLTHGVQFVLSQKFCQDPLEEHFGRHRAIGRAAENPHLLQFGHQENSLRLQRQLALIVTPKGNVRGAPQDRPVVSISNSPLKKKPKTC